MKQRNFFIQEKDRLLLSIQFFTRIPIPASVPYSEDELNKSAVYFPFIGLLVGALVALVYWLSHFVWSTEIAILLSMAAGLLLTGCFHEDGLADCMDGMGGGWDRDRILTIMQDSRIGTYGATALVVALGSKFLLLSELPIELIVPVIIYSHVVSRTIACSMMVTELYARPSGKAKPLATSMSWKRFFLAVTLVAMPLALINMPMVLFLAIFPLIALRLWFAHWLNKWIGGFTGDCLGALQQLSELLFLLSVVGLCRFI